MKKMFCSFLLTLITVCASALLIVAQQVSSATEREILKAAVIGDYGLAAPHRGTGTTGEGAVAASIKEWGAEEVITVGETYGKAGSLPGLATWDSLDLNIGQFYGEYIYSMTDSNVSTGSPDKINHFHHACGNHDGTWDGPVKFAYPTLRYLRGAAPDPENYGNTRRRYYSVRRKSVEFFIMNSNIWEPDGLFSDGKQALWLRDGLAKSTAPHRVVVMHHLPFSSSSWAAPYVRWPYKKWGVSVVLSGDAHVYERMVDSNDFVYLCNGLGGHPDFHCIGASGLIPESMTWFNSSYGWQKLEADDDTMNITFESLLIPLSWNSRSGIFRDKVRFKAVYVAGAAAVSASATILALVAVLAVSGY